MCEGLRVSIKDGDGKFGYYDVVGDEDRIDRSGSSDENKKWLEFGCMLVVSIVGGGMLFDWWKKGWKRK